MPFAFTPATGLSDTSVYPTTPANEAAARQQVMDPLNQLRDYLNTVPVWTAPTLQNAWTAFTINPAYGVVNYTKDIFGNVKFKGTIANGTTPYGTLLFNLPVGYRPSDIMKMEVNISQDGTDSNITTGWININPSGAVTVSKFLSNYFVSFDSVRFLV